MLSIIHWTPAFGVAALLFAWYQAKWVSRQDPGTERMKEIAGFIRSGAMAFLRREYSVLVVFTVVVSLLLVLSNYSAGTALVGFSFLVGALCSALSGYFGMKVATEANVRTTNAARESLSAALRVAFAGGSVLGMSVVGLAILGMSVLYLLYTRIFGVELAVVQDKVLQILSGFSLGASSIALFARVGGGIYTKSADVGADLVGKVEAGIPEDDPRNPAVIADNVGDNVGDVCGMGADLFESYVGAILGSMVLALGYVRGLESAGVAVASPLNYVILPMVLAAFGILCSIAGTFMVRTSEGGNPQTALNLGTLGAGVLMLVVSVPVTRALTPEVWGRLYGAMIVGLAVGIAIGFITEYYTSESKKPARAVASAARTGAATNIIAGLALGMKSTGWPLVLLSLAIVVTYLLAGLYGVALSGLGMLGHGGNPARGRCLRAHRRQRRRHRGDERTSQGSSRPHRQTGCSRKHHRGHRQGFRHRLGGTRRSRPHGSVSGAGAARAGGAFHREPGGARRNPDWRHGAVPFLGHGHAGGGRGGFRHDRRSTPPVP